MQQTSTKRPLGGADDEAYACRAKKNKSECGEMKGGGQCEYSYVSGTCYTSAKALADIARLVEAHVQDPKKSTLQPDSELVKKYRNPRAILVDVANTYGFNKESTLFLENLAEAQNNIFDDSYYVLLRFIWQNYKAMQNDFPYDGITEGMKKNAPMASRVLYFDDLRKNLTHWNNKQIIATALGVMALGAVLTHAATNSSALTDLMAYVYSKDSFKSVVDERARLREIVEKNKNEIEKIIENSQAIALENNSLATYGPSWLAQWGYALKWNSLSLGSLFGVFRFINSKFMKKKICELEKNLICNDTKYNIVNSKSCGKSKKEWNKDLIKYHPDHGETEEEKILKHEQFIILRACQDACIAYENCINDVKPAPPENTGL